MIIRNRLICSALAGLIGGLAAATLTEPVPNLIAHLALSVFLGALFGLSLGARLGSAGAALIWGQAFGLLWWLLGWLSLLPLATGEGLLWSVAYIQANFMTLPAIMIGFGATLGLGTYGLGLLLPLRSATENTGRLVTPAILPAPAQAVLTGGIGGLLGAWVFLRGIEAAHFFPLVASIVGMSTPAAGRALHYLIGIIIALMFALLFHKEIRGAGTALLWGMNFGVFWWVLGPLTLLPLLTGTPVVWSLDTARAAFAPLVAHLLYGAMVGGFYAGVNRVWQILFVDSDPLSRIHEGSGATAVRGVLMGQAGGIAGGVLFTFIMAGIGALPRVASLVNSSSVVIGLLLHLLIAVIIGSSFGLLFQRQANDYGAVMGWGILYGVFWWLLGALTLFPALLRQPVDWSLAAGVANYASLFGHILYGLGLSIFFQYLARRYDSELRRRPVPGEGAAPAMWASILLIIVILPLLLGA